MEVIFTLSDHLAMNGLKDAELETNAAKRCSVLHDEKPSPYLWYSGNATPRQTLVNATGR